MSLNVAIKLKKFADPKLSNTSCKFHKSCQIGWVIRRLLRQDLSQPNWYFLICLNVPSLSTIFTVDKFYQTNCVALHLQALIIPLFWSIFIQIDSINLAKKFNLYSDNNSSEIINIKIGLSPPQLVLDIAGFS